MNAADQPWTWSMFAILNVAEPLSLLFKVHFSPVSHLHYAGHEQKIISVNLEKCAKVKLRVNMG